MGWLETTISGLPTPWANRIKMTVDHTKVDEDLTDFPMLIALGSSTGTNNQDITDVFDSLAPPAVSNIDDDFTGDDGDPVDSNLWDISGIRINGDPVINNNRVRISIQSGIKDSSQLKTKYSVSGDFDVRVDWNLIGTVSSDSIYTRLGGYADNGHSFSFYYQRTGGAWGFSSQTYEGSSYVSEATTAVTYTSTKLRLTRVGNLWTSYYWNGSSWVLHRQSNRIFATGEVSFMFYAENYTSPYTACVVEYDNFEVVADGYIYDRNVNRKKIAITISDGTTQCPVEIEAWDQENEQAWLWTKVPTVYSGIDTTLYLYYDSRAPDNTNVGEIGSTVGRSVWSNSFSLVYHMAQAPPASITDSAGVKAGTPNATMSSVDLVTGTVGKALDFDGTDDDITVAGGASFTSSSTLSWVCKSDGLNTYQIFSNTNATDGRINLSSTGFTIWFDNYYRGTDAASASHGVTITERHQYTIVRDGGTAYFYVDGVFKGSDDLETTTMPFYNIGGKDFTTVWVYFDGQIDSVKLYGNKSAAWIKADYNSCFNTILTYNTPAPAPTFMFEGYTKLLGAPVSRKVGLFRRANMELVDETTSVSGTGYFELYSPYNDYHFMVILPEVADGYNLIGRDQIHPEN